jgi:acyl dehydratase
MLQSYDIHTLRNRIGQELFVSDWITVGQEEIDAFGRLTRDRDPMHMDPDYARAHSPFGRTVLFGFQILSMLSHFNAPLRLQERSVGSYELNYGLNRVRFVQPVPVDTPFRNRVTLKDISRREDGALLVTTINTIEVQGNERPAVIAEWIGFIAHEDAAVEA